VGPFQRNQAPGGLFFILPIPALTMEAGMAVRKEAAQVEVANNAAAMKAAAEQPSFRPPPDNYAAPSSNPAPSIRLIYKPELLRMIGASYGSIFSWMRKGQFPLAREIGPGGRSTKIAWVESEVMEWLAKRPQRCVRQPTARSQPRGAPR
jgi:predicted DNA-binding transcriptional regulator AlpA